MLIVIKIITAIAPIIKSLVISPNIALAGITAIINKGNIAVNITPVTLGNTDLGYFAIVQKISNRAYILIDLIKRNIKLEDNKAMLKNNPTPNIIDMNAITKPNKLMLGIFINAKTTNKIPPKNLPMSSASKDWHINIKRGFLGFKSVRSNSPLRNIKFEFQTIPKIVT